MTTDTVWIFLKYEVRLTMNEWKVVRTRILLINEWIRTQASPIFIQWQRQRVAAFCFAWQKFSEVGPWIVYVSWYVLFKRMFELISDISQVISRVTPRWLSVSLVSIHSGENKGSYASVAWQEFSEVGPWEHKQFSMN